MLLKEILDAGAESSQGNHPDSLVKRGVLAGVLVRAGVFEDTAQALTAFRYWSWPETRDQFTPEVFVEKVRADST